MPARLLAPGQHCVVHIGSVDGRAPETVYETDRLLLEAPNWALDGAALILNGDGRLWRCPLVSRTLEPIPLDVGELNNDHVLDPDGAHVFLSANDGHIYRAALTGGRADRVTEDDAGLLHFLHGVSPDGATLAFAGIEVVGGRRRPAEIYTVAAAGGPALALTTGGAPKDGPEFSPDGDWLYFNTEQFSTTPGHAQIARMRPDGTGTEQLTFDDRVNWFPHLSSTGRAFYVSFGPGTIGHPADVPVALMGVDDDWTRPRILAEAFGGQGTANVDSWSPDGERYAFVSYPVAP